MTTGNNGTSELADKHRRMAVWYRRQAENLLQQAEWHDQRAARVEAGDEEVPTPPNIRAGTDVEEETGDENGGGCGRRLLTLISVAGAVALLRRLKS